MEREVIELGFFVFVCPLLRVSLEEGIEAACEVVDVVYALAGGIG